MKNLCVILGFDLANFKPIDPEIGFETEDEADDYCKNLTDELTVYSYRKIIIGSYKNRQWFAK